MFAGCPIVATDVGEVSVALAHGEAGVLVDAGNAHALAGALDRLLSDPRRARELGERAAARALAEYDVSHMVRQYVDTYDELLGRRANGGNPVAQAFRPADGRRAALHPNAGCATSNSATRS